MHVVIVSLPKEGKATVVGVAYEKTSDLVTQYPNIPSLTHGLAKNQNPENAQVIYKNKSL